MFVTALFKIIQEQTKALVFVFVFVLAHEQAISRAYPAARKSGIEAALLAALIDDPPMKDGIDEEEEDVV